MADGRMRWRGTREGERASFTDALFRGPAQGGGLYVPAEVPRVDRNALLGAASFLEVALSLARAFLSGEVGDELLEAAVAEALDFPLPRVSVTEDVDVLELFHGPTLAFKDVGARFMAALMERLDPEPHRPRTVLVATSGDTGAAVADAFAGRERFRVAVLFPLRGVPELQRRLFTTLGGNVLAVGVDGIFDDCQRLVKEAFLDERLASLGLTSANSINVGRLLPQVFYYGEVARVGGWPAGGPVVSVPSGNLGNLTAGLLAMQAGVPLARLLAALNANDVFLRYLRSGRFEPAPSRATLANAMDVGDPSNLERLVALVDGRVERLRRRVWSAAFDDPSILEVMGRVYRERGYLLDPHGAVGWAAVEAYRRSVGEERPAVVLATAHPSKFPDAVRAAAGQLPPTPPALARAAEREERIVQLSAQGEGLRDLLLDTWTG